MTAINRKHVSIRTCVSCGNKTAKANLLRIVATDIGDIMLDWSGKINGRGTYVCLNSTCVSSNLKRTRVEHVLRATVSDENWRSLIGSLEQSRDLIN